MTAAGALPPGAKFPLGRVLITPRAAEWLPVGLIARALERHRAGIWSDAPYGSPNLALENAEGLARGGPLLSSYGHLGPSFTIATRADRSATIVAMARDFGVAEADCIPWESLRAGSGPGGTP